MGCVLEGKLAVGKYSLASSSIMPGPSGLGSAEMERCKVAVKADFALLDTEKRNVSPGRADNLSLYPAIKTSFKVDFSSNDEKLVRVNL